MLLAITAAALVGAMPCNLSLLAPAAAPARLQASAPAGLLQEGCGEPPATPGSATGRRVVSVLGGVLGSVVGATVGGFLGNAVAGNESCGGECWFGPEELWWGALLGLHLGAGLGAHLAGNLTGGRGNWQGTVLGTLAGGVAGLLMFMLANSMAGSSTDEGYAILYPLGVLMPTAGAVTGYALSEPDAPAPCAAPAPRAPMLRLSLSF